jgi:two-component system, cell cycle response regulator
VQRDSSIVIAAPDLSGASFRVLAAEDNPVFQSMLRTLLTRWGYRAQIARDGREAWDILQKPDAPQMLILDWMMPGMDGVELCRRVRAAAREPYTYILLLTARSESQDLVDGIEAGADDYLTKPFNSHELRARLRAGIRILELQRQLVLTREALREQATHDGLTGLLNRSSILALLERELSRSQREAQPLSLLVVDLDRFKEINDNHGHLAGDAVLQQTAAQMKSSIRGYDALGRYGGEEFLVVLPGCSGEDAVVHAERIRKGVAGMTALSDSLQLSVTCSIGVSFRSTPGTGDARALVREADEALYLAKNRGRNRVELSESILALTAAGA